MSSSPTFLFGTGFLGFHFASEPEASSLLTTLLDLNIKRLDSARKYPPTNPGAAEILLGKAGAVDKGFVIDTKISVTAPGVGVEQFAEVGSKGSLTREAIGLSVKESLEALSVDKVHLLQCHLPDEETPIKETAGALNDLFLSGKFELLGVCNYSLQQLQGFLDVCETHGYVKPTVYQGQYNALCRTAENDIMPFLRQNGLVFSAYSPLAGGFLTGKLALGQDVAGTRFDPENQMGAMYRGQFDTPRMRAVVQKLDEAVAPMGFSVPEVSLRWLVYHSALEKDDSVILGASTLTQLRSNAHDVSKGPLPENVAEYVERMWADAMA